MKILVTGSSGHLGEALVRTLKKEHEVVSADVLPSQWTSHVGDLSQRDFVATIMDGVKFVFHAATLHKPHVVTHSKQDFIDANVSATLNLLEESLNQNVHSFIFTSTTSTYGDAMRPKQNEGAIWVTENLVPRPKNIYGLTKIAAQNLCKLYHRNNGLPCIILQTSRFFLEEDDDPRMRGKYIDDNIKVNELLYRRCDMQDVVDAHLLAMNHAGEIGFDTFIISAKSFLNKSDLSKLVENAPAVILSKCPAYSSIYENLEWKMFPSITRVYRSDKAQNLLNWKPKYDFEYALHCVREGKDFKSPLARAVGIKGYHPEKFSDGPYPV